MASWHEPRRRESDRQEMSDRVAWLWCFAFLLWFWLSVAYALKIAIYG